MRGRRSVIESPIVGRLACVLFTTIDGETAIETLRGPTRPLADRVPTIRFQRLHIDSRAHANVDGRASHRLHDELEPSSVRKRQRHRAVGGVSASGNSSRR